MVETGDLVTIYNDENERARVKSDAERGRATPATEEQEAEAAQYVRRNNSLLLCCIPLVIVSVISIFIAEIGFGATKMPPFSVEVNNTGKITTQPFFKYIIDDHKQDKLTNKTIGAINRAVRKIIPKNITFVTDPCTCMNTNSVIMVNKADLASCAINILDEKGIDFFRRSPSHSNYSHESVSFFIERSARYICDEYKECVDLEARRAMASNEAAREFVGQVLDATYNKSCDVIMAYAVRSYDTTYEEQGLSRPLIRLTKIILKKAKNCFKEHEIKCYIELLPLSDYCNDDYRGYIADYLCKQYKSSELI
nr:MAG: hypothetical protein [Metapenaeus ensis nimavirus]